MAIDPVTMMILTAVTQAAVGAAAQQATPKYGMTKPGSTPEQNGDIDFNQLVGQQQQASLLDKNKLQPLYQRY